MRCLMQPPRVLLLDEPMVGVAPHLVERICADCVRIRDSGVSHHHRRARPDVVQAICDRVVAMASGEVVTQASYADAMSSGAVRECISRDQPPSAPPLLSARDVTAGYGSVPPIRGVSVDAVPAR